MAASRPGSASVAAPRVLPLPTPEAATGIPLSVENAPGLLLHHAATQGDLPLCEALILEAGANIHTRNGLGETCLHHAVRYGHVSLVDALITLGADPNVAAHESCGGHTPLHVAILNLPPRQQHRMLELLLTRSHADPNIPDSAGKLPLHTAAILGLRTALRLLLCHGSTVDLADRDGVTALEYSKRHGRDDVARDIAMASRQIDHYSDGAVSGPNETGEMKMQARLATATRMVAAVNVSTPLTATEFKQQTDTVEKLNVRWTSPAVPRPQGKKGKGK